jgi:hypothetical protein
MTDNWFCELRVGIRYLARMMKFTLTFLEGRLMPPNSKSQHADIYSIYSLMMTNPPTSHGPSTDEVYLIADMTRPVRPAEPCVRVPPQYEAAYQEILDEYHLRKDKPVKLERALNIAKPYELVNDDVYVYMGKSKDLFYLGDVYFNKSHTLALTAISTYCGPLCGSMRWKIFEKSAAGQWEDRLWVGCSGDARLEQTRPVLTTANATR